MVARSWEQGKTNEPTNKRTGFKSERDDVGSLQTSFKHRYLVSYGMLKETLRFAVGDSQ